MSLTSEQIAAMRERGGFTNVNEAMQVLAMDTRELLDHTDDLQARLENCQRAMHASAETNANDKLRIQLVERELATLFFALERIAHLAPAPDDEIYAREIAGEAVEKHLHRMGAQ